MLRSDDNLNAIDTRMTREGVDGATQDGHTCQSAILLRNITRGARSASRGDNQ